MGPPWGPGLLGIGFGGSSECLEFLLPIPALTGNSRCLSDAIDSTGINLCMRAINPRSTATHRMQYSRWAVQAATMTCRLQGRYAGGRDPCRLGIRPSVDQVKSSPDQRGKREKKQREPSCSGETYPSHTSGPLFLLWSRDSSLKFLYIPFFEIQDILIIASCRSPKSPRLPGRIRA